MLLLRSEPIINILEGGYRSFPSKTMTRFLCFPLLFALALPLRAQDVPVEPPAPTTPPAAADASLPRDPALLMRLREQVSFELQQTVRMLGVVNPNDPFVETLKTQQADQTAQLRQITQQLQAVQQSPSIGAMPPEYPSVRPGIPAIVQPQPDWRRAESMPLMSPTNPVQPVPSYQQPYQLPQNFPDMALPTPAYPLPVQPYAPSNAIPQYGAADQAWGPRLPKELSEMKQSIDSLQKEVGELKETIKALETQIQLLNRHFLQTERMRDSGN